MHPALLVPILIALPTCLSVPTSFTGVSSSPSHPHLPRSNGSMAQQWPSAPYRAHIANNIYLIINNYMPPASSSLQTYILTNITAIEAQIGDAGNPTTRVDNSRVFSSGHVQYPLSVVSTGLVSARFPAVHATQNPALPRITNALAVQVLAAVWGLEKEFGPRGFSFAMIEVGGRPRSYFSLWFSQLK